MKSQLNLWNDVKSGKLAPDKALKRLAALPGGGTDTQAYRRIKRFAASKQGKAAQAANA